MHALKMLLAILLEENVVPAKFHALAKISEGEPGYKDACLHGKSKTSFLAYTRDLPRLPSYFSVKIESVTCSSCGWCILDRFLFVCRNSHSYSSVCATSPVERLIVTFDPVRLHNSQIKEPAHINAMQLGLLTPSLALFAQHRPLKLEYS